ncbi:MAG TPA: orotidine-5'-phosphate decarboxylase [Terriglobales bacterium]|nr:orotidine-5'-phosphate decarboxylase [Terriglobales bacterium]
MRPEDRPIVALDVSSAAEAQKIVQALGPAVSTYKVGNQLFTAEGPSVVRELVGTGKRVFLDLKFHDIPKTVAGGVRSAAALGVSMLTVHASGGSAMLRAAVDAARQAPKPPIILAVTVLTSLSDADLQQTGVAGRTLDHALVLATLARNCGCDGVVASPHEARAIRQNLGAELVIVTPGIRPAGSGKGDQSRVNTPTEAIAAGADYLVVGRPVTEAADPRRAAEEIMKEIRSSGDRVIEARPSMTR